MSAVPSGLPVAPALGFVLTLGVAVWLTLGPGSGPSATLHSEVTGYLRALEAGDARAAGAFRLDSEWRSEGSRARTLRGVPWFVDSLAVAGDGREALARVLWSDARGAFLGGEEQVWRRGGDGRWKFEGLGAAIAPRRH